MFAVRDMHRATPRNKTGFKGVYPNNNTSRPYKARIYHAKSRMYRYLGTFETAEEAARAYDREAMKMYGPDCFINFPCKHATE